MQCTDHVNCDFTSQVLVNIPIVNIKKTHDKHDTGETMILEINHCIYNMWLTYNVLL